MIAVIADTHMPKGARRLPPRSVELIFSAEACMLFDTIGCIVMS
jgi:hypothetical protein